MTTEIKAFLEKKLPPKIIWSLMNKVERAKFFTDGQFTFDEATLNYRRRARGGQSVEHDINEIYKLLNSQQAGILKIEVGTQTLYKFFGSEYREHICAAEIFNECFGTGDKRKLMYRFNEILDTLEGWHLGKRLQKADPEYREQKKPYYRDKDNYPTETTDDPAETPNDTPAEDTKPITPNPTDEFNGAPIDPHEVPAFDPDDLPI